ncbi:tRNA-dihydrouridine(20) synthase [NAD(P)+] [Yarrowia sp. B02]|nr:tRNA-dihydrouridine(20) synthase [NAD(P)+] [Yarrowia sp. B02]
MVSYAGKLVLAPMVRSGEFPTRVLSVKYGADLVWSPEIVDKKMLECTREWNEKTQTVDFTTSQQGKGNKEKKAIIFRTAAVEREKIIFQVGSANPEIAVAACKMVAKDVAGIDLNCGCPKHFSMHAGMGAALLKTPDKLVAILEALVKEVGEPFGVSISVKIRLLETEEKTLELVERLAQTGVKNLTIHCRTTPMRPREPVIRDTLAKVAEVCHKHGITCLVNGDVEGRHELADLQEKYGVDGAMIARAAEANASCFRHEGMLPWQQVAKEYLEICREYDNFFQNTKYCLTRMIPGKSPSYKVVASLKDVESIEKYIDEQYELMLKEKAEEETKKPEEQVLKEEDEKASKEVEESMAEHVQEAVEEAPAEETSLAAGKHALEVDEQASVKRVAV